jgi:hypothetical protein
MKSYIDLYPKIVEFENIMDAWRKARKGKRYTAAAATFDGNLETRLS